MIKINGLVLYSSGNKKNATNVNACLYFSERYSVTRKKALNKDKHILVP